MTPVRGDDDPLAVLPLDRSILPRPGRTLPARDIENGAVTILGPTHGRRARLARSNPTRHCRVISLRPAMRRRKRSSPSFPAPWSLPPTPDAFSSPADRSRRAMRASFKAGSDCARSMRSSRSASLANWLPHCARARRRLLSAQQVRRVRPCQLAGHSRPRCVPGAGGPKMGDAGERKAIRQRNRAPPPRRATPPAWRSVNERGNVASVRRLVDRLA